MGPAGRQLEEEDNEKEVDQIHRVQDAKSSGRAGPGLQEDQVKGL